MVLLSIILSYFIVLPGGGLSSYSDVHIEIEDINDHPPVCMNQRTDMMITENQPQRTQVGQVGQ